MERITQLFKSKKSDILSVFFTAGFPHLDDTVRIAHALDKAGADLIEIGIPFSDPVADGPVIQDSNKQALANGMNLPLVLEQVAAIRTTSQLPIVLMGYLNPVMQYGVEAFAADAARAGVDGLILPDLPLQVYEQEYQTIFQHHNLAHTFLISPPTSEARIRQMDSLTDGFLYAVSASSTTGARAAFDDEQETYFARLQAMNLRNPFLVGFGVSNAATYSTVCRYAAGAIVGSAFIKTLASGKALEQAVPEFINHLRGV